MAARTLKIVYQVYHSKQERKKRKSDPFKYHDSFCSLSHVFISPINKDCDEVNNPAPTESQKAKFMFIIINQ